MGRIKTKNLPSQADLAKLLISFSYFLMGTFADFLKIITCRKTILTRRFHP